MKQGLCVPVLTAGLLALAASPAAANNIRVTNVLLQGQETNARTAKVGFNLAWENSWRSGENWDAAWVIVKFRAPGSNEWQHAVLSTNSADHLPAANSTIAAVPDGKGVFIYRAGAYTGNVNYGSAKLQWNYGSNGYNFAQGEMVDVSVHAIEMVYVPAGPFYLGSGGSEDNHFYQFTDAVQDTQPFVVSSEDEIIVGTSNRNLYCTLVSYSTDRAGPISNVFPKGYTAFYCMKYEITQGQYADFLNKLTPAQWTNRQKSAAYYNIYRHSIYGPVTNSIAAAPDRGCNYLEWGDLTAYMDWAALRPMTELEFEKACRGPTPPLANEYAWGSASATNLTGYAGTDGSGTETASPATANYVSGIGPARVGIFATNNATRISAGAGYYGVMELSGNLFERIVTVGNTAGRSYRGTHGNGLLDVNGNATGNADWPAAGCFRGGSWANGGTVGRLADRTLGSYSGGDQTIGSGGRAVRAAP